MSSPAPYVVIAFIIGAELSIASKFPKTGTSRRRSKLQRPWSCLRMRRSQPLWKSRARTCTTSFAVRVSACGWQCFVLTSRCLAAKAFVAGNERADFVLTARIAELAERHQGMHSSKLLVADSCRFARRHGSCCEGFGVVGSEEQARAGYCCLACMHRLDTACSWHVQRWRSGTCSALPTRTRSGCGGRRGAR